MIFTKLYGLYIKHMFISTNISNNKIVYMNIYIQNLCCQNVITSVLNFMTIIVSLFTILILTMTNYLCL